MTWQRVESERLILVASLSLSPVAPVLLYRSEPARSTMLSFPTLICAFPSSPNYELSTVIVKTEWLLELCSFIFVAPTCLFKFPSSKTSMRSYGFLTTKVDKSLTYTPVSLSLSSSFFWPFLLSKSLISSL